MYSICSSNYKSSVYCHTVLNINNASCGNSNGQISVAATGGGGGFVYALNNGAFGTDSVYSNVAPGVDTIRVKDNSGCIVTVLATVSNIQGPEITVLDSSNVSCFGNNDGSITLTVSGTNTANLLHVE
ncbi:MAG: hypothetical protein R2847_03445 [Bacteroidia bacterium]